MWALIVSLIYTIPSLILYFTTVIVLVKNWKSMKSSFFILYLFDFSMNLSTSCFTFICLKLSAATCLNCYLSFVYNSLNGTLFSQFLYAMMYHMSYVQYGTTAVISLNRLSVIYDHYTAEKLWNRFFFIPTILLVFVPFVSTGVVFAAPCVWRKRAADESLTLICNLNESLYTPLIYYQGICIVVSIVCNISSFLLVARASPEMKAKAELNFIILITVTTIVQLLGTGISQALNSQDGSGDLKSYLHSYLLPVISDAITLMHPWLLVLLSKPIRRHIRRDVLRQPSPSVDIQHVNSVVERANQSHQPQQRQGQGSARSLSKIQT